MVAPRDRKVDQLVRLSCSRGQDREEKHRRKKYGGADETPDSRETISIGPTTAPRQLIARLRGSAPELLTHPRVPQTDLAQRIAHVALPVDQKGEQGTSPYITNRQDH
jgi:hypothetical protein